MPEALPSLSVLSSRSPEPSFNPPLSPPPLSLLPPLLCAASPFVPLFLAILLFFPTSSRLYRGVSFADNICPSVSVFSRLSSPSFSPHSTPFFLFHRSTSLSPSVRYPILPPPLRDYPFLQSEVSSTCNSLRILIIYGRICSLNLADLYSIDFN